jgi:hypothetical protein
VKDIEGILGLNVCDPEKKKQCWIAFKGKPAEFKKLCAGCKKKNSGPISPRTAHILKLRLLVLAGYPFEKNDLSFEEWMDLGTVNEMLKR